MLLSSWSLVLMMSCSLPISSMAFISLDSVVFWLLNLTASCSSCVLILSSMILFLSSSLLLFS